MAIAEYLLHRNEQVVELANEWYDKFTLTHTGG